LLRSGEDIENLQEKLEEYHANDIASALPLLEEDERKLLYNALENERLGEVMEYAEHGYLYLEEMSSERAAVILSEMEPDDAVDLLKEAAENQRHRKNGQRLERRICDQIFIF